jgi:hypothetical protein
MEEEQIQIKDMSRARRRFYVECLKKKRSKYYSWWFPKTPTQVGKLVHTPANCSCEMCGNPRKFFKQRTIQEKKQLEFMESQIKS